jgi:hypothetical protein
MAGQTINGFIHAQDRYIVIAPLVVAQLTSGHETYVYRNGTLPASTLPSQIDSLLANGLVRHLQAVSA